MSAEVLLRGGAVITLDPVAPPATAVAIGQGRILGVGGDNDLDDLCGPATRVLDVPGCAIVPGFVDAHIHFGSLALARQQLDLDAAPTIAAGLAQAREFSATLGAGVWLRGRGWDRNRWGRLPTALELDDAVGGRPAALSSHDGHAVWLNGAAMTALEIGPRSHTPVGGVIERDASGQPTGVFFENAEKLVRRRLPEPSTAELVAALGPALKLAAAAGLTGIHNIEDERSYAAFEQLEAGGELRLRVYHGMRRGQLRQARQMGLRTGAGSEWLRIGPVKLFADGALGSRTAYMLEPYEGATDGYRGVPTLTPEELVEDMRTAAVAELDVAVHAIGDAAVRSVLDAVEVARRVEPSLANRRVRIEHAQLVHPEDVPRFAQLGVVASMQPIHAIADWRIADEHWGTRAKHGYAWRDLLDAGAHVAFGTDAPVERLEPLASLHAALTRLDASDQPPGGWHARQCVTLEEALRAYSGGSAFAERAESRRGAIRAGMDADLVVLDPDPRSREPAALRQTQVRLTVVGGRIVHES